MPVSSSPEDAGVRTPPILYGTAWKEERTQTLTEQALEAGFRGIDTANQRRHYYEEGVGRAVSAAISRGLLRREELFLQTKFTYVRGQDHRLPYDPAAPLAKQVEQSMASSLGHLGTSYVDCYVLHGPAGGYGWSADDAEVWEAMISLRDSGRTKHLGVSNVSAAQLEQLLAASRERPSFVQNRCYASAGWDHDVRVLCSTHGIRYQGFSLLTANPHVVGQSRVAEIASRLGATRAQVVLRFAQLAGMLPLTGTTDPRHMRHDLECADLQLTEQEVRFIESCSL